MKPSISWAVPGRDAELRALAATVERDDGRPRAQRRRAMLRRAGDEAGVGNRRTAVPWGASTSPTLARASPGRSLIRAAVVAPHEEDGPAEIAAAIAGVIGRAVDCRPVETDGARRAAKLIAELL